jgi:hypothetical protein
MSESLVVNTTNGLALPSASTSNLGKFLSSNFELRPENLSLVAKMTTKEGATPGMFRAEPSNEQFKELKVVLLRDPQKQREYNLPYKPGQTGKDFKECYSRDAVQPDKKAKNPPALYCGNCPMNSDNQANWEKWRKGKEAGATKESLRILIPPCKGTRYMLMANYETKSLYHFTLKGVDNLKEYEATMEGLAREMGKLSNNAPRINKAIEEENTRTGGSKPLFLMPTEIWHLKMTLYSRRTADGNFLLGIKDVEILTQESRAVFESLVKSLEEKKKAGQLQTQEASEAEEEAAAVSEAPAGAIRTAEVVSVTTNEVAVKNSQIQI